MDFLYYPERVRRFYPANGSAAFPPERRAALVGALALKHPGSKNLDRLAQPDTVAVVTGQQVGLFSGPAYTIYKALTAARLARHLSEQGTAAVPVFWLATEDHDLAEVNHAWSFDKQHQPVALRVAGENPEARPVGGLPLNDLPMEALERSLAEFPQGAEVMALVSAAYQDGRTMGESFAQLVHELLKPYDILMVDPLDAGIRAIAAPLLRDAVEAGPELTAAVLERNAELAAEGYHAQVHVEPDTSFFFLLDRGRRLTLKRSNGQYASKTDRYNAAELGSRAERLSPNALLRPVVQDFILPTAAYVGGPAELAYLAQSDVLYQRLLGRSPRPVARNGFTLLDARATKLMRKYGLRLTDFFHGEEPLRERISETVVPRSVHGAFESAEGTVRRELEGLRAEITRFDPTLAAALDKSRVKMEYQLAKTARKIQREALRRNQAASSDAAYLYGLVCPQRHLQERFYTILPFLAKHGLDLIGRVYENVHLDCPDHIVLEM
jgi:bacillithiol biosynthesis cysteine-adding enzyme BshC